jgi:DNA-binding CsgD family transcriptional regulator
VFGPLYCLFFVVVELIATILFGAIKMGDMSGSFAAQTGVSGPVHQQLMSDAVEQMLGLLGEASGLFYKIALLDQRPYVEEIIASRSCTEAMCTFFMSFKGKQMPDDTATAVHRAPSWRRGRWRVDAPSPLNMNRFALMDEDVDRREVMSKPIWSLVYTPFDIDDQVRALVYDGPYLVGWFGAWRHGRGARFGAAEIAGLNARRAESMRMLRMASTLAREQRAQEGLFLIADAVTGAAQHASSAMRAWLSAERAGLISAYVRGLDPRRAVQGGFVLDGVVLRPLRMEGESLCWLLVPGPRSALKLEPARLLSARQLEVARLLCSGISEAEAASLLAVEPSTVKFHRKAIFSRLGVQSRGELIRFFA